MLELRHLRYFVAVAEELHFGRAAIRLHIAQPPLSQQIRRLEDELGVRLFDRTTRRVELTHAGLVLLNEARRTLVQADRVRLVAQEAARGESGHLRIGFVGSALYGILPSCLRAFRAEAPGIVLTALDLGTSELVEGLLGERLDVAFVRPPIDDDRLAVETVDREPLVAALPVSHPLAARTWLDLRLLAEEPFVLFARHAGPGYWDVVQAACREAGFRPNIVHEAGQIHTIIGLVAGGLGLSLVPSSVRSLQLAGVRFVELARPAPVLELAMAWRVEVEDPTLERFVTVVRATATARANGAWAGGPSRDPA